MATRRTALLLSLLLAACSADIAPQPEPTLVTSGAFVAVASDDDDYELLRTLTVLGDGGEDDVLFLIRYAARPRSFDEARQLAKDPELAVASDVTLIGKRYFHSRAWKVVWFRSLTEQERAAY